MALFSAASSRVAGYPVAGSMVTFVIQNNKESNVIVKPRRGVFQRDWGGVTVSTAIMVQVKAFRGTAIDEKLGDLEKVAFDTSATASDPAVEVYAAWSPDLSNVTGLSSTTSGGMIRQSYAPREVNATEQWLSDDGETMPELFASQDFILYPGQAYIVQLSRNNATSDAIQAAWFYNCVWEETALSTYTISGNVTNSGTGVVGAEVTVIVADDTSLTNAYLHGVYTTTAGGAWSANIPTGKMAYAYASDFASGTYYTAPGNPFIT